MKNPPRRLPALLAAALVLGAGLLAPGARFGHADEPKEEARRMIVMVRGTLGGTPTFGAGIVVGSGADRLYVATANHVVRRALDEAEELRIELRSLPGEPIEANLLEHVDENLDLAVLNVQGLSEHHISVEGLPFALLGDPEALEQGDPVFHVGNPNGDRWRANVSPDAVYEVSATEVRFESTFIAPGSSGGGLFDERWTLVGLVRADQPPDGVATRIDRVLERLTQWGYPVDLTPSSRAADGGATPGEAGTSTGPELPAGAVEGWTSLGYYERGRFFNMAIEFPGDAPAIGSTYRTVKPFRMVAKKPERGEAVITLGTVPEGSIVQVLDLEIEPGTERVPVYTRLRAVVESVRREPPSPAGRPGARLAAPRQRGPECGSTIRWSSNIGFSWYEVEGAASYTVEVDCLGCSRSGRDWYSEAEGRPWHLRPGLGRRSPYYGSSVGSLLRADGGHTLRWRVWAVDREGQEGPKSEWCRVAVAGLR